MFLRESIDIIIRYPRFYLKNNTKSALVIIKQNTLLSLSFQLVNYNYIRSISMIIWLISCGSDATIKNGFNMPFVESAHYLGMEYLGDVHTWIEADKIPTIVVKELFNFVEKIKL